MPRQVLGAGLQHEVRSQLQRALVDRSREGRVDEQVHAGKAIAHRREPAQIGHAQVGIGRGLGDDELRPTGPDGLGERAQVARLDQRVLHPEPGEERAHELARAAVAVRGEDDVVARLEQLEQGGGHGGHPAGEESAVLRTLQRRDLALCSADRGIAVAAVLLPLEIALEVPGQLRGVGEAVGRGADDRRGHGVVRLAALLASVHGQGGEAIFARHRRPAFPAHRKPGARSCAPLPTA